MLPLSDLKENLVMRGLKFCVKSECYCTQRNGLYSSCISTKIIGLILLSEDFSNQKTASHAPQLLHKSDRKYLLVHHGHHTV